ncbi:YcxB family protein [Flavobacterium lacus]|uniref:YcxB-like protein n=1 Tax=Flavobacterium lacus TaxID=1353778 RepID=A0A328WRG3_9FLAO|nr:YcxB family protein [Flavobacterium lacus]RAR47875.1 YcxB-like protein [Flavobacterium lacus]
MENEIIIKPSFDAKTVCLASFHIIVGMKTKIIFSIFLMLLLFTVFFNFFTEGIDTFSILKPFIYLFLFVGLFAFSIYIITKKQISQNPKIKENISHILNNEYFQEKGESFEIKYFWKEVIKIVEKKDFFLIFIAKNKAIVIKKIDLKNNQYNELNELFKSLNLKK